MGLQELTRSSLMVHLTLSPFLSVVDLPIGLFSEMSMSVIENLPIETLVVGAYIYAADTNVSC
jgi:hypothetical protein